MKVKLFDSELKLMNFLWDEGELSAQQLALRLSEDIGWSKTTTYTVIKKCIEKGIVQRTDPGFICRALVSREQARSAETNDLIDKLFGGSPDLLVASLIEQKKLSAEQIKHLRGIVNALE